MKKLLSAIIAVVMVAALFTTGLTVSAAVTNFNHNIDNPGELNDDATAWSIFGWSLIDSTADVPVSMVKVGYRIDSGDIVWTVTEVGEREEDSTLLDNDAWRDSNLETAVASFGMANGRELGNFKGYRIKITADITGLSLGQHTMEVVAMSDAEEVYNPFRGAIYNFTMVNGGFMPAEATNSLVDEDTGYTSSSEATYHLHGWFGVTSPAVKVGYSIDGGEVVYDVLTLTRDTQLNAYTNANYSYRYEGDISVTSADHDYIDIVITDRTGAEISVLVNANGSYTIPIEPYTTKVPKVKNFWIDSAEVVGDKFNVAGWFGAIGLPTIEYYYTIDGGEPILDAAITLIPLDINNSPEDAELHADHNGGHWATRFVGEIDISGLSEGEHELMIIASILTQDGPYAIEALVRPETGERVPLVFEKTASSNVLVGDVTGDGKINNKDVTRLFRHLSGLDVEVVIENCDITGDGKINNKDYTRLFKNVTNGIYG